MKMRLFALAAALGLAAANVRADINYATLNYPDAAGGSTFLTGIRAGVGADVLMSGVYTPVGTSDTQGLIYSGGLDGTGVWNAVNATISGETVTSTALYGPNTIAPGSVRIVGSYKNSASANDHGLLYTGAADGTGTYQNFDVVISGTTATNTIAHSTDGNLAVGNYDDDSAGKAFIYNFSSATFSDLAKPDALSVTAYGVWHNGGTSYTIAGGYSNVGGDGTDEGYLVDYDSATGETSHWTEFNYDDEPISDLASHFDGITGDGAGGYNLTGDWIGAGEENGLGFFAHVGRNPDGTFTSAEWTQISYPGGNATSGNSVLENTVIGVYTLDSTGGTTYGFTATVPEPAVAGLLGCGGLALGIGWMRRRGG